MQARLVAYLLQILDTKHIEGSENTASTKAQIVKTLKAMTMSLEYGEEVKSYFSYFCLVRSCSFVLTKNVSVCFLKNSILRN